MLYFASMSELTRRGPPECEEEFPTSPLKKP